MFVAEIKTVPHDKQRYDTVGDYWTSANGTIHFRVSDLENWKYESLVAIHELVEKVITNARGIHEDVITRFDEEFEKKRQPGNFDEPGDDPTAPYNRAHIVATLIEEIVAIEIGVDWNAYDLKVRTL